MKRLAFALALLGLMAGLGHAELKYTAVSATQTSQTIGVHQHSLTIVNDGANEVYVRLFANGENPGASTTAYAEIKSGEGFSFTGPGNGLIEFVSIVCATGETATVRLLYW